MTETQFQPGDKVMIDHAREGGRVFTVVRKLPRNYRLQDETGRVVIADPRLLRAVPDLSADDVRVTPMTLPPVPAYFAVGQTVRLRGKPGVFVVLKATPRGYSVAPLGGDRGRYWNVDARNLTAVKVTVTEDPS